MDSKKLGVILIIVAFITLGIFVYIKSETERLILLQVETTGSCYEGSTCSHERANILMYVGIGLSAFVAALGFYLILFDKGQRILRESHEQITTALQKETKEKIDEEKFKALLAGLDEDEKKVIIAVSEQDGIQQSTLKYRTGLSKTKLSMVLKGLEDKDLVTKEEDGKTNKIFIKKAFLNNTEQ